MYCTDDDDADDDDDDDDDDDKSFGSLTNFRTMQFVISTMDQCQCLNGAWKSSFFLFFSFFLSFFINHFLSLFYRLHFNEKEKSKVPKEK